jgi:flagellar biosynthetic protein FliQ
MTQDYIIYLGKEAVYTILLLSAPMLGVSLLVGLLISIFQATTQIQEQTLTFVPKLAAILICLVIFGPWMLNLMVAFTTNLISSIPHLLF